MDESWDGNRVIWHGIIQHDGGREKEESFLFCSGQSAAQPTANSDRDIPHFCYIAQVHSRIQFLALAPPSYLRIAVVQERAADASAGETNADSNRRFCCWAPAGWRRVLDAAIVTYHERAQRASALEPLLQRAPLPTRHDLLSRKQTNKQKRRKLNIGKTFHVRHTCGLAWPFWQKLIHPFVIYVVLLFVCVARQRPMNHLDLLFHLLRNCCAHRSKSHEFAPDGGERTLIESRVFLRRVGRLS